jgi:hypothetical protein
VRIAVVGADVPVADVVAHDHEDIGLLLLLRDGWCRRDRHDGKHREQTDVDTSDDGHDRSIR